MKLKIAFMCLMMVFARATTITLSQWQREYDDFHTKVMEELRKIRDMQANTLDTILYARSMVVDMKPVAEKLIQ